MPHQECPDPKHLTDVTRHQTDRILLEIIDRQIEHLVEHVGRKLDVKARRQPVHQKLPQKRKRPLKGDDHKHRQAKHIERIVGLVVDHLVRQQAPEHDRRQPEQTQHEGGDRDVARHPSFAKDQRGDQAKAERLGLVGNLVVALHQDDVAGPDILKPRPVDDEQRVVRRIGIAQRHANVLRITLDRKQHHAAAVAQADDGRQRLLEMC